MGPPRLERIIEFNVRAAVASIRYHCPHSANGHIWLFARRNATLFATGSIASEHPATKVPPTT